jgi:hypothetical protein
MRRHDKDSDYDFDSYLKGQQTTTNVRNSKYLLM